MNIQNALTELKETWGYETEELNHIRELMEEISSVSYGLGYSDRKIDDDQEILERESENKRLMGEQLRKMFDAEWAARGLLD